MKEQKNDCWGGSILIVARNTLIWSMLDIKLYKQDQRVRKDVLNLLR